MDQWPLCHGSKIQMENGTYSENVAFVVEEKDCISRHTHRRLFEAQEADHLANLGAEGQRKITVEKGNNSENWKVVRGVWDGSKKTDVRSGCGVVIKCVDMDEWITISIIAIPPKACAAMAAEVVGASVLTGVLDLVLGKTTSVDTINQCIDDSIKCT